MSVPKADQPDKGWPRQADENVDIVIVDCPGDTTVRPSRYELPREWPRPALPPRQSSPDSPSETEQG